METRKKNNLLLIMFTREEIKDITNFYSPDVGPATLFGFYTDNESWYGFVSGRTGLINILNNEIEKDDLLHKLDEEYTGINIFWENVRVWIVDNIDLNKALGNFKDKTLHKCSCDISVIMNVGCKCGGI